MFKGMGASEEQMLRQLLPAVQSALAELGTEAKRQLDGSGDGTIEMDAISFVASVLRRRNPRRGDAAMNAALDAAEAAPAADAPADPASDDAAAW